MTEAKVLAAGRGGTTIGPMKLHTDRAYEAELEALTAHVYGMSARAEAMVRDARQALFAADAETARAVVRADDALDRMEIEADRQCLNLLVRRAPVGEDLRFVAAVLKAVTDIERIGDLAVNIAERTLELLQSPGFGPEVLRPLADASSALLGRAFQAFRERDSAAARRLAEEDHAVDELNREAFRALVLAARQHPAEIERALALASIARHLERIGDHAVNIGERVVFLVDAEELRHRR